MGDSTGMPVLGSPSPDSLSSGRVARVSQWTGLVFVIAIFVFLLAITLRHRLMTEI
jgi:hypothetical protein